VRTRNTQVSARLLGSSSASTSESESASGGVSYSNPARAAMLKRLLR